VSVFDTIAPTIIAQNDTVYLDAAGMISITTANVDAGSWDSCGIASVAIDTSAFTCANTANPVDVELTVIDANGNTSTETVQVFVLDTILPSISCIADIVVSHDFGQCGAVVNYFEPMANDNCGVDTVYQSDGSGILSGDLFPVGTTTVQFTAVDANGNTDSC